MRKFKGFEFLSKEVNCLLLNSDKINPIVNNYLNLNKIYLKHLPIELIFDIINSFKSLTGENKVDNPFLSRRRNSFEIQSVDIIEPDEELDETIEYNQKVLLVDKEINEYWNRSIIVSKTELMHRFGFSENIFLFQKTKDYKYDIGNVKSSTITEKKQSEELSNMKSPLFSNNFDNMNFNVESLIPNSRTLNDQFHFLSSNFIPIDFSIPTMPNDFNAFLNPPFSSDIEQDTKTNSNNLKLSQFQSHSQFNQAYHSVNNEINDAFNLNSFLKFPLDQSPRKNKSKINKLGDQMLKLTFQQFISALFITSSSDINISKDVDMHVFENGSNVETTIDNIFDNYIFKRMIDNLSAIVKSEYDFKECNDEDEEDDNKSISSVIDSSSEKNETVEDMIPCEFCTDSIRVSQFEAHIIACQAGNINNLHQVRNHNTDSKKRNHLKSDSKITRPTTHSIEGISLIEDLLNSIIKQSSETFRMDETELSSDDSVYYSPNFTSMLESCFNFLDRDHDGFLTSADFSTDELDYCELQHLVDPFQLYEPKVIVSGTARNNLLMDNDIEEFLRDDDFNGICIESTPISLQKTNSLWMSVSNEKSMPIADPSRSYSGLGEAEYELSQLIDRTRYIIDDSESTAIALLIHYKWDLKSLVEDYIENKSIVRYSVGLGSRSSPSFFRYDYYKTQSEVDFSESTPICDICKEPTDPIDCFSLPCLHWFCRDCWEGFLTTAINDRVVACYCPQSDCKMFVTEEMKKYLCNSVKYNEAKSILTK